MSGGLAAFGEANVNLCASALKNVVGGRESVGAQKTGYCCQYPSFCRGR